MTRFRTVQVSPPELTPVLLKRPDLDIFAALLLTAATTLAVFVSWLVAGAFIVVVLVFALLNGYHRRKRQLDGVVRSHEAATAEHEWFLAERGVHAGVLGAAYEAESAEPARGFGRIDQEVPDDLKELDKSEEALRLEQNVGFGERVKESVDLEWARLLARRAAGLTARGVLRMRCHGFAVTAFDVTVIDEGRAEAFRRYFPVERAAELAGTHLTVWTVDLPLPLPRLSSAHPWGDVYPTVDARGGEGGDRVSARAADTAFAELLMSVPAVREHALAPDGIPWTLEGDRVIASTRSDSGLSVGGVAAVADDLGRLCAAFPWADLERFRIEGWDREAAAPEVTWTHRWSGKSGPPTVERWGPVEVTRGGLCVFAPVMEVIPLAPDPGGLSPVRS